MRDALDDLLQPHVERRSANGLKEKRIHFF
jgi:hypothetical protein